MQACDSQTAGALCLHMLQALCLRDMKALKLTVVVVASIFLGYYIGFKIGVSTSEETWLVVDSSAREKLGECIQNNDFECASNVMRIQNVYTKARVEGLLEKGWFVRSQEKLESYLKWLSEHQPKT